MTDSDAPDATQPTPKKRPKPRFILDMDADMQAAVKERAAQDGKPAAALIRSALRFYMERTVPLSWEGDDAERAAAAASSYSEVWLDKQEPGGPVLVKPRRRGRARRYREKAMAEAMGLPAEDGGGVVLSRVPVPGLGYVNPLAAGGPDAVPQRDEERPEPQPVAAEPAAQPGPPTRLPNGLPLRPRPRIQTGF